MAMIQRRILILVQFVSVIAYSQGPVQFHNSLYPQTSTVFARQNDSVVMVNSASDFANYEWCVIEPIQADYDKTVKNDNLAPDFIKYRIKRLGSKKVLKLKKLALGTRYYASVLKSDLLMKSSGFTDNNPIHLQKVRQVVQLVVRENDSYLGYLTELINTPFILPPVYVPKYGHQTDLRMGSDCAELAIYGKRREGFKIPYCGPFLIVNYLDELKPNQLFEGCVIHFRSQVSVLYKDNGVKNILDKDDLIIQSYLKKVSFVKYSDCGFYQKPYRIFKWKERYQKTVN